MKPQRKDYKLIIEADNNNEVYWKLLKKGELSAHNQGELMLAEEMLKEVLSRMEKFGYWHNEENEEISTEEKIDEIGTHKPINFISESDLCTYQQGLRIGAREMASWLEEQMIQKAVKWFIKNTNTRNEGAKHFVVSNGEMIQEVFIENFKQAMKGGGK